MKRTAPWIRALLVSAGALLLGGCAVTLPSVPFKARRPVPAARGISMGSVRYLPAEAGRVKPNQIERQGDTYLQAPVATYVRDAFAAQLARAGRTGSEPRFRLESDVEELSLWDGRPGGVIVSFRVRFTLGDASGEVASRTVSLERKHGGPADLEQCMADVNELLADAFETFFADPAVASAVEAALE